MTEPNKGKSSEISANEPLKSPYPFILELTMKEFDDFREMCKKNLESCLLYLASSKRESGLAPTMAMAFRQANQDGARGLFETLLYLSDVMANEGKLRRPPPKKEA